MSGSALTKFAFEDLPVVGPIVLTVGLLTFVFSTILGWAYYGEKAAEYLFGPAVIAPYRVLWVLAVMVGSVSTLQAVWSFSDVANGLMAVPNLISLLALNGVIVAETATTSGREPRQARHTTGGSGVRPAIYALLPSVPRRYHGGCDRPPATLHTPLTSAGRLVTTAGWWPRRPALDLQVRGDWCGGRFRRRRVDRPTSHHRSDAFDRDDRRSRHVSRRCPQGAGRRRRIGDVASASIVLGSIGWRDSCARSPAAQLLVADRVAWLCWCVTPICRRP
jgi:hypothetical protein